MKHLLMLFFLFQFVSANANSTVFTYSIENNSGDPVRFGHQVAKMGLGLCELPGRTLPCLKVKGLRFITERNVFNNYKTEKMNADISEKLYMIKVGKGDASKLYSILPCHIATAAAGSTQEIAQINFIGDTLRIDRDLKEGTYCTESSQIQVVVE
jgi:hypothetical protein